MPVPPGDRPRVHRGPRVVHQPIPRSDLDPDAVKIINRLTRFEHGAYLVGGCVRDLLLERKPKDFDIGTSATPRQIKRLFRNCRIIGRRFRLAHIYFQNGKIIEVATFRAQNEEDEGGNGGGGDLLIRDDNLFGTMEEDALRRDFTINSLFYDVNQGNVLDHADGLGDLRRRLVRTIGDPTIRFREDPIRILRAIKFAARLDFKIEPETLKALRRTRDEIPKAAPPRILEEINRFCRGGAARRSFELLRENEIFEIIAPEIVERLNGEPQRWGLLYALLDSIDTGSQNGGDVTTGQILANLVLPAVAEPLGWRPDGTVERNEKLDVRAVVDEVLRPLALRLRIARRDQEYCRQVISVLHRMVPTRALHRNTKRSILRRACLAGALSILDAAARSSGGDLAAAGSYWASATAGRKVAAAPPARRPRTAQGQEKGGARRRRSRGSRGGRGRRRATSTASAETPRAQSSRERQPRGKQKPRKDETLPPVWDDNYFFAALPTVPESTGETTPEKVPENPADPPTQTTPRHRRKRRPRRRRKTTAKAPSSSPPNSED